MLTLLPGSGCMKKEMETASQSIAKHIYAHRHTQPWWHHLLWRTTAASSWHSNGRGKPFPNKRDKLSSKREKEEQVPLRIQTNKHSTWPRRQRTSESSNPSIHVVTRNIREPSKLPLHMSTTPGVQAEGGKLSASVCTSLVPRCTGERAQCRHLESTSGTRPAAAASSLRARIPGWSLSLETRPSIGCSAAEDGASRSERDREKPGRKAWHHLCWEGGVGWGDCIRAIGCAEETRASLLIRKQPASSVKSTVLEHTS